MGFSPKEMRTSCVPGVWPRCPACPCRAPELAKHERFTTAKRASLFPSGEQPGGPCCNCAFRPSKSAPLACPASGVDAGHVLAELRSSSIVFWGPLGRAPVGDSKWAGRAPVVSSESQCTHLWGVPKGNARAYGRCQMARRASVGESEGQGAFLCNIM